MPIEEIAQKVSDRYAKAASMGEQLCGSAGYDMAQLKSILETPNYAPAFAVMNRAGHTLTSEAVSCAPNGGCC